MSIAENIQEIENELKGSACRLIAVTKTKPIDDLQQAYNSGCKCFGENKVQEMVDKYEQLPKNIEWHMIGHLQSNKVKYMASFVHLIHGVDSFDLLKEINKRAVQNGRIQNCLLQVHIAQEETKFGFDFKEIEALLISKSIDQFQNVKIIGLMGMASNSSDMNLIRNEFKGLKLFFEKLKSSFNSDRLEMKELSMGMSGDYKIAVEEGSTLVRIGSKIFGERNNVSVV